MHPEIATTLVLTNSQEAVDGYSTVSSNVFEGYKHFGTRSSIRNIRPSIHNLKSLYFSSLGYFGVLFDVPVLASYIARHRIKTLVCACEHYAVVAYLLSFVFKLNYIVIAHGTYGNVLPRKHMLFRKAFERAKVVVCVSQYTKAKVASVCDANVETIGNGIDKDKFKYDPNVEKTNSILFVGNAKKRKGLKELLDALLRLPEETLSKFQLKIVGMTQEEFANFAGRNGVRISAEVLCFRFIEIDELVKLYQSSFLNVLVSQEEDGHFEGFGLVHAEAISCGTFTIGALNSGNVDVISADNGLLVDPLDTKALSAAIEQLLNDEKVPMPQDRAAILGWDQVKQRYEQTIFA